MKTITCVAALMLFLSGCATPYKPAASASDYGYSESRLDEDKFSVRYIGSDADSAAVVSDYTFLRAAEVTLEHGFTHFEILDSRDQSKTSAYTTPVTANTQISPVTGQATTYTYGGISGTSSEPQSFLTIVCHRGKPTVENGAIFDAEFLKNSLREKYGLDI